MLKYATPTTFDRHTAAYNSGFELLYITVHQHIFAARIYLVLRAGVEEGCSRVLKILLIALKVSQMLINKTSVTEVAPVNSNDAKATLTSSSPC